MKFSILVIAVACCIACGRQSEHNVQLQAKAGVLDLQKHDFTGAGSVDLNGEWEYYPGELIQPEDLAKRQAAKKIAQLPRSFNSYTDPALRLPAAASATYRLTVQLPDKLAMYVMRIPPPATASRVFINNHLEIETGHVSERAADVVAAGRMQYFQGPLAGKTEILIHVSNVKNRRGGIWQKLTLGAAPVMISERLKAIAMDMTIAAALITIALYHLALALLRSPDKSIIHYAIFCFLIGLRRLLTHEQLMANFLPELSWEAYLALEYFAIYAGGFFFQLYVTQFFRALATDRVTRFSALVTGIFALLGVILPVEIGRYLLPVFQWGFFFVCVYLFYHVVKLARRGVFGADVFAAGILALTLAFINDSLGSAEIIRTAPIISYAIFLFIFVQAFMISGKSLLVFRDNTNLSEKLLRSDRLRDDFLTQTTHELRTPVQAMVQTAENLRRGISGAVSEQVQRSLAIMEENGQRLLYLIDDLSDFIRLKHNDIVLNPQQVSLKKTLSPVMQLCLGLSENPQLVLVDEIPEDIPDILADAARLQQMLLNLLNTAIRHSHSPIITVRATSADGQLAISVIYHGNEPEAAFAVHTDDTDNEIGPRVTQKIAELMGGRYLHQKYAESEHSLIITLPYSGLAALEAALAKGRHRNEYRKAANKVTADFTGLRPGMIAKNETDILIVGENNSQNRLLQEQLLTLGKQAVVAKNGAEAMLLLQNNQNLAMVICDVLLPDVSGIELAMNIRMHYDIGLLPIILIIDNNQAGIAASAFSAGVNDLIRRPFEKAEVLARVKNVLLQREASLARESYRALSRELEIARSIQEAIIPVSKPKSNLYKIEAVCMPARSIGGDFYDFIEDEDSVAILIADVAGHGIPAALYASMLKIAFHNLRDQAKFPENLLKELNDVMVDRGDRTFISCAYTLLDFKNKRLLHANAGHLPLLLQEPGRKRVKKVHPPGGVLGVRKAAAITVEMQHLQPKTRLILFTDGVIELSNRKGELFEEERLIEILEEMRDQPLADLKERLLAALRDFAEGDSFLDDVTFVLVDL